MLLLQITIKIERKEHYIWGIRSWHYAQNSKSIFVYTMDNGVYVIDNCKVIGSFLSDLPFENTTKDTKDIMH